MFHEEDDPSTPCPPPPPPPSWSENYGNVRASANPPLSSPIIFCCGEGKKTAVSTDEHRFPDNFSPFVSCVRLGGRASPWQGATLVACAYPCDATCYETRNVTALADYLANEGFFRPLLLFVLSFGFEHASLQFSRREKRNANAMGEESWNNR